MVYKTGLVLMILLLAGDLFAGEGKLRIASEPSGAYVYVDGKKRAMTGDGFTSILVEEGDHVVKVVKPIDEGHQYIQSKKVFIGSETSLKLTLKLKRELTAALQAQKLARFKRSGEVVTDTKLGLMWQDDSHAQSVKRDWSGAKRYCKNFSLGGYSDWRLPTYYELVSIVDYDRYKPAIMPSFQNVASKGYWSSSVDVSDSGYAWYVNFEEGYTAANSKSDEHYVRCVRGR